MGVEIRAQDKSRPVKEYEIEVVQLTHLIPHEMTIPLALENFKNHVIEDGMVFRPILVDRKTSLILDGHHRRQGLLDLGYQEGPVIMIDYLDNDIISIDTWYPLINRPILEVMENLMNVGLSIQKYKGHQNPFSQISSRQFTAVLISDHEQYIIFGKRELIFKIVRELWLNDILYYDVPNVCAEKAKGEKTAIISWSYTKEEILDHLKLKTLHLPKTTRHVTKYRYPDCNFPLTKLAKAKP